jgi:hypothetical protein
MSEEAKLHQAVRRADAEGRIAIEIDFRAVNRSGAPGFRTTDIVVPPFVIIVLSAYLAAQFGWLAGLSALALGGALLYRVIWPWNRGRTEARTRALALAELENWTKLWSMGGLALRLTGSADVACAAPAGDWRAFVRDRLLNPPPAG